MKVKELKIKDTFLITLNPFRDERGFFVKTFQQSVFQKDVSERETKEEFYSLSYKNVLRGMHLQLPPADSFKSVSCISGTILDVLIDLRKNSPTYLTVDSIELTGDQPRVVHMPAGVAHGFLTLSEQALMVYRVGSEHVPHLDSGIFWNSIPFEWPVKKPILSERDRRLTPLEHFKSTF